MGSWLDAAGLPKEDKELIEEESTYDTIKLDDELRQKELKAANITKGDSEAKSKPWVCTVSQVPNALKLEASHPIRVKNVGEALNQLILRHKANVGSDQFSKHLLGFQLDFSSNRFAVRVSPVSVDVNENAFNEIQNILVGTMESIKPVLAAPPAAPKKRKAESKPKAEPKAKKPKKEKKEKAKQKNDKPELEEGEIIQHMPSITTTQS